MGGQRSLDRHLCARAITSGGEQQGATACSGRDRPDAIELLTATLELVEQRLGSAQLAAGDQGFERVRQEEGRDGLADAVALERRERALARVKRGLRFRARDRQCRERRRDPDRDP